MLSYIIPIFKFQLFAKDSWRMTKRKMDIKELKKAASKGKKLREINVKYETVLSYFKQKDTKNM